MYPYYDSQEPGRAKDNAIFFLFVSVPRPVATYFKVVRRISERVPKTRGAGVGRAREGAYPSRKGVSGDVPRENF